MDNEVYLAMIKETLRKRSEIDEILHSQLEEAKNLKKPLSGDNISSILLSWSIIELVTGLYMTTSNPACIDTCLTGIGTSLYLPDTKIRGKEIIDTIASMISTKNMVSF